jgi:hypothetical protein
MLAGTFLNGSNRILELFFWGPLTFQPALPQRSTWNQMLLGRSPETPAVFVMTVKKQSGLSFEKKG